MREGGCRQNRVMGATLPLPGLQHMALSPVGLGRHLQDLAMPLDQALFQNAGSLESPSLPWNCLLSAK